LINYTERITLLMQDIVSRVPTLSFIDVADVLVFARPGRSSAEGAFATCHCLSLPPSEPGYYFWRDRSTGQITRRSEWFVTRSPVVSIGARQLKYLISFSLPRFCDQTFERSRKERFYPSRRGDRDWIARLDTIVHELYHIDPDLTGIRRIERGDGTYSAHCHGHRFFEEVAAMVETYLDSSPDTEAYDFLKHDFAGLEARYDGVVATSFRSYPSYPQRFIEPLVEQPPSEPSLDGVEVEKLRGTAQQTRYTEDDLHIRQFLKDSSRRLVRKGAFRAA
jgi:hypothetical protein